MTQEEYLKLSADFQQLARTIPLQWGNIQNDSTDKLINMFQIHSIEVLEKQIANLSVNSKNYFRRRWFLWKCAQCDEYLFCLNTNVSHNPNTKDQDYDIEFNNNTQLRFDIKGTVIPKDFRNEINTAIVDPTNMIRFFYENQSKGIRNNIQNRLFIIHHSYRNQEREMYLRCHWGLKINIYKQYAEKVNLNSNFISFQNAKADVIFILENLDKTITYSFFAVK